MTTTKTPSRKLGYWETACKFAHDLLYGTGNVVSCIEVIGTLNQDQIKQACHYLFKRHPLLTATLKEYSTGSCFELKANFTDISLQFVAAQHENHWQQQIEVEMRQQFSPEKSLWRVVILSAQQKNEIIITAHHAIADALSLVSISHDLLTIYAQLAKDEAMDCEPLPFNENIEKLLAQTNSWDQYLQYQQEIDELAVDKWDFQMMKPLGQRQSRNIYRTLEPKQLQKLIQACKQNHVTVNALLNAIMLLTAAKMQDAPVNTTLKTPINLRKYCQPILADEHLGCNISMVKTVHTNISKDQDSWTLARSYQQQLSKRIPQLGFLPSEFSMAELDIHDIMAMFGLRGTRKRKYFSEGFGISNLGRLSLQENYGDLKLNSFVFCTTREVGDYVIFANVTTVHHKMFLTFTYTEPLISQQWAEDFVEQYLFYLSCSLWACLCPSAKGALLSD